MVTTRLAIAALVAAGLAAVPLAAQAKKHKHIRHYISTTQSGSYGMSGTPTTGSGPTTQSGAYGASGTSVGTVTAPSVGSYNWPSVGVTNAVPTWSNTGPAVHR
jgi:hypothetical protein